ncbi:two-component system, OmpR family, phosphate regulon sensor histidine kinase PhoR [Soonwooa buanensis]|uniref:histidine kinase n=2 Tax=Soonwooa buanensis TaxID=619805 RepID=A0A1T5GLY1_9FLAO|nr:two-component system, OmpR family, phosphate regulon sensor histidine kinase PhoR [Soonwooa buanensis]
MLSRNRNIIVIFSLLFLILLGIQAFFMYKTYVVKEREIYRNIRDRSALLIDKLEERDRGTEDAVIKNITDYATKKITEKQFLDYYTTKNLSYRKILSQYMDDEFKKQGYEVATELKYNSIIVLPDSIDLLKKPINLYQTERPLTKIGLQTTGSWNTESSSINDDTKVYDRKEHFKIFTETNYQIVNIKQLVFQELALLILLCVFILGAVLWLFILTVKNLIKQQKQVEVLHNVVDNISHEFKTPIATLKIAAKSLNKDWNKENLPLVERQIQRLENLMKQLHDGENENEVNVINFEDWTNFVEDLQFANPETEFIFENKSIDNLPFAKTDMETVVKNLCENSIKYGATQININVESSGKTLLINVKDNGEGIAKAEQKNIFEKFYRIQSDNIHNTKGLGLGLFLIKNIVKKYNGNIDLQSESGKGSLFKIKLNHES